MEIDDDIDDFYNSISSMRVNDHRCSNTTTPSGYNTRSIPDTQLILYKEGQNIYCFNLSDIDTLLSQGSNPYTGDTLPQDFISQLIYLRKNIDVTYSDIHSNTYSNTYSSNTDKVIYAIKAKQPNKSIYPLISDIDSTADLYLILQWATAEHNLDIIKYLIGVYKLSPFRTISDISAFGIAAEYGYTDITNYFLSLPSTSFGIH